MRLLLMIPLCIVLAGCASEEADIEPSATTVASETAPDPHGHDHHGHAPDPADADEAHGTAAAFLDAYLDTDLAAVDAEAWLAAMEPHTHGPYLESLATADPDNLYTDALATDLAPVPSDRDDVAAFEADGTDGATWRVELYAGDGRWLVYAVSREAAP